ncbi:MAG: hypothetical protein AAF928_20505, partial [Myxococcota bacterium]
MKKHGLLMCAFVVSVSACAEPEPVPDEAMQEELAQVEQNFFFNPSAFGSFDAAYVDCDEYAGVGPVFNNTVVDALVPDDYIPIDPFQDGVSRILVAQAGSCADIEVEGQSYGPGIFAQIGIGIVPPITPGNGDFYQLAYATTNPLLALRLRLIGVNARWTPFMTYDISNGQLTIDVPRPKKFAFTLSGPITEPDPNGTVQPTTVFNYFAEGRPFFGNINQQNVVQGIIFGEGSGVTLTPNGSTI